MSRALHLESGILDECRLSFADDGFSAFVSAVFLAVFLYGFPFQMKFVRTVCVSGLFGVY